MNLLMRLLLLLLFCGRGKLFADQWYGWCVNGEKCARKEMARYSQIVIAIVIGQSVGNFADENERVMLC